MIRAKLPLLGALLGCLVAFSAPASFAAERTKVILSVGSITATNWPGLIAQEKGFFRDEGLDVELIQAGQSSKAAQQVMAGVAQFGSSSMVDAFRAIDGGGDLVIFMNSLAQGIHSLVAAKNIKSVADLKSKRVMVGGQKDITGLWWYAMARNFKLDGTKDVDLLFSGSTANRTAALASGGIEASVLSPPNSFQLIDKGFTDLGPVAGYLGEFPMMVYHVNKTWAASNNDKIAAFIRAHNRAVTFLLDPKNKDESCQILAKASGSSVEDAARTLDLALKVNGFVPTAMISDETLERVRSTLVSEGDLKEPVKPITAFYDVRFAKAAEQGK
ncbi:ABC transporter substrate-binding protein [Bosea sp. BK604]|uniref:ABC transporter substrate-binding protein n=1 Tax=Bosea sp. BK604 TaxID=2512180 RepID=UPI001049BEC4|nr:ABC transporter substrate-binding protein [Bosea sp. BK604]TCR61345.1 NitT/TauT family transport system substrate-binding protein [Bosea sp. BK604]